MQFTSVNAGVTHYHQAGTGSKSIVFVNALGTDLRIWDDVLPGLSDSYSVYTYDKRGHGLSDAPDGPYDMDMFTDDLVALLDFWGINETVLVGVSVGGMIAMNTTLRIPERVVGMLLGDTMAKIGSAEYWEDRINKLKADGMESLAETILSRWFAPNYKEGNPSAYGGYLNMLTRCSLEGYTGTCSALAQADLRSRVDKLTCPTLVVCGAEDSATTPEAVKAFAETLPNARFKAITGAGHTPSVEQPALMAKTIADFLKEIDYV